MKKLSTGDDATLANYRKLAAAFFGEDSPAVKYLDEKIKEQGENEEVIAAEEQVIQVLLRLHTGDTK